MADPPRYPDADDGTGVEPDSGLPSSGPPRAPRWVKVSGIIVGVLILLVVIVKLTGLGGDHGPGRHTGASGTPPAAVTEIQAMPGGNPGGHAPPEGSY
ncbi:hypothetical protein [Streptomyces sp. TRM68367]|uniref:hypothetical protein n=1 Tax=Streptomyces sp. TRM68367 TaxID=2758415 RepID=UPI00165C50F4|nr:hypothetical protein [Streptomyces sp. TRM68367]MBC9725025.1 hypothetical protein [Streptomyces sp. TRM68367]